MHKHLSASMLLAFGLLSVRPQSFAQTSSGDTIKYNFAMPSLLITPDARASGMCNVGIAMPADPNTMHFNPSNLVFSEKKFNLGLSYTPNIGDLKNFLNYFSVYKHLGEKTALGGSFRFVGLGRDTVFQMDSLGNATALIDKINYRRDMEFKFALSRKLGKSLAIGVAGKYVFSNPGGLIDSTGQFIFRPSNAVAIDISATYNKHFEIGTQEAAFRLGLNIANIGTKLNYTANQTGGYLPAKLGLGFAFEYDLNKDHALIFAADLGKMLVPRVVDQYLADGTINPQYDVNGDSIPDFAQQTVIESMINSFKADGVDGLKEIAYSFGLDYMIKKSFSFRIGHQNQNPSIVLQQNQNSATTVVFDRNLFALGFGGHYSVLTFNLAYTRAFKAATNRVGNFNLSLLVDLSNLGKKKSDKMGNKDKDKKKK